MKQNRTLLSILAAVCIAAGSIASPTRPNVVLIVCDDLNDYITGIHGDNGHSQSITPNIEKLAKTGVAFRRAYSNNPVCAPSRSSFMTGIYSHTSGNLFWAKWYENKVLKNGRSLAEHFKENGYYVLGTGKLQHHPRPSDWDLFKHKTDYGPYPWNGSKTVAHTDVPEPFSSIGGIDGSFGPLETISYIDDGDDRTGVLSGGWGARNMMKFNGGEDRDFTPDERNAAWAIEKIYEMSQMGQDKPFFMGIGFVRPHTPMIVPQKYFDMYPLEELELPPITRGDGEDTFLATHFAEDQKGFRYFRMLLDSYPEEELAIKKFAQAYLASVTAVDENIGDVVRAIDDSPFKDNTIIVVTSDHGWQMGQKDYLFKNSPWEESTRIPFVVRAPGITKAGKVAEHPISLIDLYPTLVDLCGLDTETRKNDRGAPLDGFSVRPFLEDPENGSWEGPDGALTMVHISVPKDKSLKKLALENQIWSYRTERWRYILYPDGSEELYDHDRDPRELTNESSNPEFAGIKSGLQDRMMKLVFNRKKAASVKPAVAKPSAPAKKRGWDWFAAVDVNKDGKALQEEWLAWAKESSARKGKPFNPKAFSDSFRRRDVNGDGYLSRAELK